MIRPFAHERCIRGVGVYLTILFAASAVGCGDSEAETDGTGDPQEVTVEVTSGSVAGMAFRNSYRAFLGIPYAAPPVGQLRWAPPIEPEPWTETFVATELGDACPQPPPRLLGEPFPSISEDCLTVNVWTPDPAPTEAPVMVWIHGGGFVRGSSADPTFDGALLAERGMVVVTLNYRLGALGFLAHQALTDEDPDRASSGNYGLLDQRLALRWVHDNIATFGGDPSNVTIFGESAGSISVCLQLLISRGEDLIHRAIMQSGVCGATPTLDEAEADGELLAEAVGCHGDDDIVSCLRDRSADEIVNALPNADFFGDGMSWGPVVDGVALNSNPMLLIFSGQFESVPTILGSNKDEGTSFVQLAGGGLTEDDYIDMVHHMFPSGADAILAEYTLSDFESVDEAAAAVIGDGVFVCSTRLGAQVLSGQHTPTWMYHFTHEVDRVDLPTMGAFHTAELRFVFGNPHLGVAPTAEEKPLTDAFQTYWSRFAATGNPNGDDAVTWPQYTPTGREYLLLDLETSIDSDLKPERCDFWDAIYLTM